MLSSPDPSQRQPDAVCGMFRSLVDCYDRLNLTMTFGMDRLWRKRLVELTLQNQPTKVLDLAAGTGDVALLLQESGVEVMASDFCEPMLERAREKGVKHTQVADALELPFEDAAFDAVTVAWGYRNFTDREKAAQEVRRVLKPGGWFHILESSEPDDWRRPFHRLYCQTFFPLIGKVVAGNADAYSYLANTVAEFPKPEALKTRLGEIGFTNVTWESLGMGAVCVHSSQKLGTEVS
ncbi:MAG: ubiquinone/menaquinone biosynthesis methyltransferase [Verrucomicrobiota bacterium]